MIFKDTFSLLTSIKSEFGLHLISFQWQMLWAAPLQAEGLPHTPCIICILCTVDIFHPALKLNYKIQGDRRKWTKATAWECSDPDTESKSERLFTSLKCCGEKVKLKLYDATLWNFDSPRQEFHCRQVGNSYLGQVDSFFFFLQWMLKRFYYKLQGIETAIQLTEGTFKALRWRSWYILEGDTKYCFLSAWIMPHPPA